MEKQQRKLLFFNFKINTRLLSGCLSSLFHPRRERQRDLDGQDILGVQCLRITHQLTRSPRRRPNGICECTKARSGAGRCHFLLALLVVIATHRFRRGGRHPGGVRDDGDQLLRTRGEATSRLPLVHVLDHELVQDRPGATGSACEVADLGIVHRELRQLASEVLVDEETVFAPEVRVVGQDRGEAHQEARAQLYGALLEGHGLHAVAFIDEGEERLHVVAEDVRSDDLDGRLQALRDVLVLAAAPAGADVGVQPGDHLRDGQDVDELITGLALGPADLAAQRERAVLGEPVEQLDDREILAEVPEEDVRGESSPVDIEDAEPLPLHRFGGVAVYLRTEAQLRVVERRVREDAASRARALEPVDDEDGVGEQDDATTQVGECASAHTELDVRHESALTEGLGEGVLGREGEDLPLVRGDLQRPQRSGIDGSPDDDLAALNLVESSVNEANRRLLIVHGAQAPRVIAPTLGIANPLDGVPAQLPERWTIIEKGTLVKQIKRFLAKVSKNIMCISDAAPQCLLLGVPSQR